MAAGRHFSMTALAVMLLLCLSWAVQAQAQAGVEIEGGDLHGSHADVETEPQHAPQFPEEPAPVKRVTPEPQKPTPAPAPTSNEQPQKEEKKEEKEKEDPCKRVPGCLQCSAQAPHSRRLKQLGRAADNEWNLGSLANLGGSGGKKSGKPEFNSVFVDMVQSPYNAKDLPYCTACNTTGGYVAHTKGRCACAPGYGDISPTGTCNKCPGGFFSTGGFRAVCVECEGVAFSNVEKTACVCASGWYGITSYATKQASCNQCPGSRPVSGEGARSASDCKACPEGMKPNDVFSDCVDPNAPPAPAKDPLPLLDEAPASNVTVPDTPPLFNESTFEDTKQDWILSTRNTQNHSNPFSDFLGSIMESVVMGKNITATAARPGDLLYQVLTKPAPSTPKMPTMPSIDLQNPQQIGAGVGAAFATVPKVLGAAAQNGGKISDVVDSVVKAVETSSKAVATDPATSTGNGWGEFLKGLAATAPKDNAGKSEVAEFAKSLGDLFGVASKVATEVAEKSDNTLVKSFTGLLSAAKKGDVQVPVVATPEIAKAEPSNNWGQLLQGLANQQQAAAPAPVTAPQAPSGAAGDWTKLFSSLAKGSSAPVNSAVPLPVPAASTPAAASPSGTGINNMQQLISGLMSVSQSSSPAGTPPSSTDLVKMLASLTATGKKAADPNAVPHTIVVSGVHTPTPRAPADSLSSAGAAPNAPANILQALSHLASPSATGGTTTHWDAATETARDTTQKVWTGNSATSSPTGSSSSLGNLLGGLFGGQKGSSSWSFANPGGKGQTHQQTQAQLTSVASPPAGFISVPSAPPKGSTAIKSGKVGNSKAQQKPGSGKQGKQAKKP